MTEETTNKTKLSEQQKSDNSEDKILQKAKLETEKSENKSNSTEIEKLKEEIKNLKAENRNIKTISALEKSGCIKPELVSKAVPEDCENLQDWIDTFKSDNEILFKQNPQNHGGNYKPTNNANLSPTELMNNYIRGIY